MYSTERNEFPNGLQTGVGNLSPAVGARNQVGIGLSYRPASLCSFSTQFQTRFLESIPRSHRDLSLRLGFLYTESLRNSRPSQELPLVGFTQHTVQVAQVRSIQALVAITGDRSGSDLSGKIKNNRIRREMVPSKHFFLVRLADP